MHHLVPFTGLCAIVLGATLFAGHAAAQGEPPSLGTVAEMPLPGGLQAALKAMGDRVPADRSRFLIEVIQRVHDAVPGTRKSQTDLMLQALLAQLERSPATPGRVNGGPGNGNTNGDAADPAATRETLPLPLSSAFWIDTVMAGRATPDSLAAAILRSRNTSLLYYGLLSLDHETRAWFGANPALVAEITLRFPGAFVVAAPALRVAKQSVQVPGGAAAAPAWHALVGRRVDEPVEFVRAVVTQPEGRLAYFIAALASLTPAQTAFALRLEAADPAARVDALRRLFAIFERSAAGWKIEERPFWRPRVDPALLVAELDADERGRPVLPGNRTFWTLVLTGESHGTKASPDASTALSKNEAVDFVWLCEQIFKGSQVVQRRPYEIVLFASRLLRNAPAEQARHAVDAMRTASTYPALAAALERARVSDLSVYANAARRADRIVDIDDDVRAARALAQYQGSLALLTRAAARGTISPEHLASAITSLAAVEMGDRGDYEGRLVRWLSGTIATHEHATAPAGRAASDTDAAAEGLDERVLHFVSGPPARSAQVVEWEGTRYRLDFRRGEASRVSAVLGENAQPYFSIAAALVAAADALAQPAVTRDRLHEQAASIKKLSDGLRENSARAWLDSDGPSRLHAAATALAAAAQSGSTREAARLAPALLLVADDLLGRALVQLAYAVALGQPDQSPVSAGDAASRHDFGLRLLGFGRVGAWRYPVFGADRARDWRGSGSLLGLDLRLAQYALMPLTSRPPSRPSLNDTDRRVFIETAVLQQPHRLSDADGDAIVGVIARGRERVDAARTAADIGALGEEIRVSPLRRTLLEWLAARDADRVASSFSRSELLWLGLEGKPLPPRFHAWGTSGEPRIGCDCLQMIERRPWESFAGRWDSGILATIFADLNLRLAELLRELRMPAALLSHVLPAAALDLVNHAVSRWQDDHRGLLAFVDTLPIDRVEQYLALLTTNGPLVPVGGGSELSADSPKTEVRR